MGEQLLGSPRPGHGRVFVNCNRLGEWSASWQDDYPDDEVRDGEPDAGVEDFEGTQDEVIRWARTRPAEKFFIFSDEANAYLPLEPADAAELPAAAEHRQRAEQAVQAGAPALQVPLSRSEERHPRVRYPGVVENSVRHYSPHLDDLTFVSWESRQASPQRRP
jgi:hypothetical protein